MQLSKRLQAVSDMVTSGSRLADLGTDHGYIPIYLVEEGRIPEAIAMDINRGPLQRAQENIQTHGLEKVIQTRLSDGGKALAKGEADSIVIAGMGGGLVMKILSDSAEVFQDVKEFILQPQSELYEVRKWLQENEYCITDEDMVLEDGKYYPMMHVVHGKMNLTRTIDFKYGPFLIEKKHACLAQFLDKEEALYQEVQERLQGNTGEKAEVRKREIEEELRLIREAKECMR